MRSAFLSLIFFVFIAAATTAQGAEDVPRSVRSLARQLADDHLAVRDAAEQGLIEIGPAALPYLPAPNAQMPAEVLRRLNRVRQQLELKRSQDATDGRRLSLKAKARKLSSVLKELEKLSGNRVVDYRQVRGQPNIELPITVDLQNVPFWQALDRILDEAGMAVYPYAHDKRGGLYVRVPSSKANRSTRPAADGPTIIRDSVSSRFGWLVNATTANLWRMEWKSPCKQHGSLALLQSDLSFFEIPLRRQTNKAAISSRQVVEGVKLQLTAVHQRLSCRSNCPIVTYGKS